jgi:hypothetical protein
VSARGELETPTESRGFDLLVQSRELVTQGWCQGADARDAGGASIDAWDTSAESWSILGAIVAVLEREAATAGELPLDQLAAALYALADVIETESLVSWNDCPHRTAAEVVSAIDGAIAHYEAPLALGAPSAN